MTRDEIRQTVLQQVWSVAPEAEGQDLPPDADIREELDLDSMDFLNVVTALHEQLQVDIPESDYPKVATLRGMTDYLASKLGAG